MISYNFISQKNFNTLFFFYINFFLIKLIPNTPLSKKLIHQIPLIIHIILFQSMLKKKKKKKMLKQTQV